jgi:hypothetical protein
VGGGWEVGEEWGVRGGGRGRGCAGISWVYSLQRIGRGEQRENSNGTCKLIEARELRLLGNPRQTVSRAVCAQRTCNRSFNSTEY